MFYLSFQFSGFYKVQNLSYFLGEYFLPSQENVGYYFEGKSSFISVTTTLIMFLILSTWAQSKLILFLGLLTDCKKIQKLSPEKI